MIIINVKTIFEPLHKTIVKDIKCPNCQAKDHVEIVVYQKHTDTGWIYKVTKILTGTAYCLNCNTDIPNVKWTPEIESAFEKLKTESPVQKSYIKLSFLFKLLLCFLAIMAVVIAYFIYSLSNEGKIKQKILQTPTVNNKLLISHAVREDYTKTNDLGNSWAVIKKIDGDTIIIQFSTQKVPLEQLNDSEPPKTSYDGKIYKIKKEAFQNEEKITEYHQEKGMGLNYAYIWKYKEE
ncbi:hypothetical protein [Cellulophaga baltica]|uniref:Uncharacterized protein n=1 Tax=Cellulophaga baltica TaxID=76594 RepID=A0A1G7LYT8_9FLAO|nr:hypothetical protein [Cellulophaga baltica]SDF54119.1 hypothetical protein SAMN04487992_12312 [Cellulophaga baltica]